MSLLEQINADMKSAMKAKEKDKLQAIRSAKTAFTLEMTKTGASEIEDAAAVKIIQKLVKQRKDAADTYKAGGREDLAEKELLEMSFLEVYLPAQMSDEELTAAVQKIIEDTGASSMKEMGKVMGIASKQLAGKADGKAVADKVKALLS
ncbi:GatB/YqeY domain-containing protein [Marinifilum caeruleilacunae]|uniref:GatB/YqeY domain-containing protein n=1 Tax=Marinifilum caeruleilacunae TaxID=2499076 RepID=A0ABX1WW23_9BACT|nr:GatB/YqeY domain-containing protein [Marinifilum caeruleilacunae]NOU60094.1 GatB/YqeY domain-containing protein [Marinifilum caeruleilacunae]